MTDRAAFEAWWEIEGQIRTVYELVYDAWQESARQEREACAKLCEEDDLPCLADAIRSRGNK